jgi:type IV pilus assembly protein PilB
VPKIKRRGSALVEEFAKGPALFSVIRLVDALIEDAYAVRASDVHLDPEGSTVRIRMRVDGVLQEVFSVPLQVHSEMLSRIKVLCGLRTDEHQAALDGRFCLTIENGPAVDVRVSIVPTYHSENAVLRLLTDRASDFTLESLDFTPGNQEKILRAIRKPYGMILATGPTGSGKTTTLYALIKMLNSPDISIITIEDPIEYSVRGINQIQVNQKSGLTFANGLRSLLRQDPNIIMVGEIRDIETAGLAVNTALTGHLILSTLHTNDAPTTLPRLLDMKVEPYLIASTVNLAIGQRLIRRICTTCKEEWSLSESEAKSLSEIVPAELLAKHSTFYRGKGCDDCNETGYRGRIGIHEVLELDAPLREAVLQKASAAEFREVALLRGMVPMIVDGFEKAALGHTSIEEVLRMRYE